MSQLPEAFISKMRPQLGDEWECFLAALNEEAPTSVRLNPTKHLETLHLHTDGEVPWASSAYYLKERPVFTLDPLFHAGTYYVQEASSMYLEQHIRSFAPTDARVLDLCAAPGGKSTHLSSLLSPQSLLVANEVIRSRSFILSENLTKWGNSNTIVTNNDPKEIGRLTAFFDVLVTDVPCSGEGMFRKDHDAMNEWSPQNVRLCAERQRRIMADVWDALKPGGLLIYSTCTYNREENEENIDWICEELGASLLTEPRRFMPHRSRGEGFFIAALRKTGESRSEKAAKPTRERGRRSQTKPIPPALAGWLTDAESFSVFEQNGRFVAIPSIHLEAYKQIKEKLSVWSAGVELGEQKGKDLIPAHALALSNALNGNAFPRWEVGREEALRYLRKETLQDIPAELPRGYVLITYERHPLGFIKNIGNRANNLYPSEWRIRMRID